MTPEASEYTHYLQWLQQKYPAIYVKYCNSRVIPQTGSVIHLTEAMKDTEDFDTLIRIEFEYYQCKASPAISRTTLTAAALLLRIGQNITRIRRNKAMTQATLASLCKMEKASISRIESGKTNVSMFTLLAIASTLEVTVSDLVTTPLPFNGN